MRKAAERFFGFFVANIGNKNTRRAYYKAACRFSEWCKGRGLRDLSQVKPMHVAAYIEGLQLEKPKGKDLPNRPSNSTWPRCGCCSTGWWSAMCLT